MNLLATYVDALIPFAFGLLVLLRPQALTKKDLRQPEHADAAKKFKLAGWFLLVAAALIFIAQLGQTLTSG